MSEEYPNPCCRCGLCCLSENCPAAMKIYGVAKYHQLCPGLEFDGDEATCLLVLELAVHLPTEKANKIKELMGIGKGCCILATGYKDGKPFDFASCPKEVKIQAVRNIRGKHEKVNAM